MNCREAVMEDIDEIHEIANKAMLREEISRSSIENIIKDREVFVAEQDESLTGYLAFDVNNNELIVTQIGVLECDTHREVTQELLEEPISYAESNTLDIRIAVEKDNAIEDILKELEFDLENERLFGGSEFRTYRRTD